MTIINLLLFDFYITKDFKNTFINYYPNYVISRSPWFSASYDRLVISVI